MKHSIIFSDSFALVLIMLFFIWKNLNLGMYSPKLKFFDFKFLITMSIFLLDSAILVKSPLDKFLSKVKTLELMSLKLSYIKSLIEKSF
jgi:hypothetical protein